MLNALPKHASVAEIGVERGLFSVDIIKHCEPSSLTLVDSWTTESIWEECQANLSGKDVEFVKAMSFDYLARAEANSLDWVYIDTDHTYSTTKKELELAAKCVKSNGYICGHDYTAVGYDGLRKYGVVEAVNEFCVNQGYEFAYLTSETDRHLSYAIKKINS